jgi:hypothetical protein
MLAAIAQCCERCCLLLLLLLLLRTLSTSTPALHTGQFLLKFCICTHLHAGDKQGAQAGRKAEN